jgi:hypothetical protein
VVGLGRARRRPYDAARPLPMKAVCRLVPPPG